MNLKKVLAMLLVLCLMLGTLSACGKDESSDKEDTKSAGTEAAEEDDAPEELTLPLTEEKQELTVWLVYSGSVMSDLNEIEGVKKMEEMTNVHINWIPINQDQLGDKLGIMLSSGSYPDILYPGSQPYPGGWEKGIADGIIYDDMDTLIRKYMPNYMAYLEGNEEARKEATSDSGKMNLIKNIVGEDFTTESEGTYQGVAYRKDILDSLGIEEPKTIEEWHQALLKAQESGIEHPFMLHNNGGSFLSLAWGVSTISSNEYLQIDGDKVVGSVAMDGFGEYLETMRQWYSEGLIDPNFTSFNYFLDTPNSVENNQHLLYSLILSAFTGNNYAQMHMVNNQDEFLQPIVAPPAVEGAEVPQYGERIIAKDTIAITTACKDPVLAAKWLDFQYSKEGELLNWYGIEGTTYTMEDGVPTFTDTVLKAEGNPSELMERYALNWGNCWLGKHNTIAGIKVTSAASGGSNQQLEAVEIWSSPKTNIAPPTRAWTPTDEEGDDIAAKVTAVSTLVSEYAINYIIGQDDTSFEDFKQQLDEYGYQEIISTYQTVYDRYLSR